ncbi:MAG: hypothetical protein H6Q16_1038 [Bacteroidetes bacterium]|nr:hypothetical protein [Bacteroidota bacterium]
MKQKQFKISTIALALIVVLSIGFFSACEEKEDSQNSLKEYPITEISINIGTDVFKDLLNDSQVYVVNTQEEYEALLGSCLNNLPQIDFSRHSFVVVWSETGCVLDKSVEFFTNSTSSYNLKINLHLGDCTAVDIWYTAFYTNFKINDNAIINLDVNKYY